jgi:uncharacterized protein DUF6527
MRTQTVRFIPDKLEPGVLHVSDEFSIAVHLCACGCGATVRTPLGPTDWEFENTPTGPTLFPSIGNWQRCESHYLITAGNIIWADRWTPAQIAAGRRAEQRRSKDYFDRRERIGAIRRAWRWLTSRFRR